MHTQYKMSSYIVYRKKHRENIPYRVHGRGLRKKNKRFWQSMCIIYKIYKTIQLILRQTTLPRIR